MTTKTGGSARLRERIQARVGRLLTGLWLRKRVTNRWQHDAEQGVMRREYRSYDDYVTHQRAKLERVGLAEYDVTFRQALAERLAATGLVPHGSRALCLAARIGTEVKAFIDVGCFAVGIDLNPGQANRYVVTGDFLDLQFADRSF